MADRCESGSLETLRGEAGFTDNQSPQALLYLYLRHALMLGYYDSSYNFHRNTGVLSGPALLAMRTEPPFVHVAESADRQREPFRRALQDGEPHHRKPDATGERLHRRTNWRRA